ncbi:MAG: DNA-binding transcriptional activator [Cyclobacteriaceae bacterium]|nr:DNA-binding transcriptional activator [Cyclobacteriaceae bacterium]
MFLSIRIYCCIMLAWGLLPLQSLAQGGLKFQGSEQPINQRTSYNVFGDRSVRFSGNFNIGFNLSLYPTTAFGYILRIKNKDSDRIYNLFYDGQGSNLIFRFNEEGKNSLIVARINREELLNLNWFKVDVLFDLKNDSIKLTIHNQTFSSESKDLPDTYHPVILFGKSDHIIDVPSFAIKDLAIGNQEKYFFTLHEGKGNTVYDRNGKAFGEVSNPEWLINDAYHWRHKASFKSKTVAGANYNAHKKEIYYFNKDSLFVYNVWSGSTSIKVFEEKCPVKLKLGTNFIDTKNNKLYSYEPYNDDYTGPTVASLDLSTYQWSVENSKQLVSPLHHHGAYFNPLTEQYTIFGGFGRMHYSKDFYTYDLNNQEWDTLGGFAGDFLSPRYFSSVGYSGKASSVYIFGGMGNESGEQTVGRQYYYDLYKIDLGTRHISKLWEIKWERDNMVPVRGMIIADDTTFYTLCYPEHFSESYLRLYRFSLKDGHYEILGDSIPIQSDKITTNANLYYDSALNSLYTIVQEFDDDISSDLKVYSLSFPPVTAHGLESYSKNKSNNSLIVIILSSVVAIGILYALYRKLKSQGNPVEADSSGMLTEDSNAEIAPGADTSTRKRPNSITLFGDFTVRNRKNRDITYMFSAQLKQILCLTLQYSTTEGGIASQRLSNILWPDKPADKVKNSRGVTINHLRKALSELDGIELIYDKGNFKIEHTEAFYCDYTRCMHIISSHDIEAHRDELVEIVSRGKFLQLFDHPLYDSFKEEMEKKLEPVLLLEMEKTFEAEQYQTAIAFAEALANIDPLNDTALTFQVRAMQRLKLNDEAKLRYRTFVIEYKKVMGTDYPHPYNELN